MTPEELAAMIDGREYGKGHVTSADASLAKAAGLLIVHGESDDLMEFRGAIEDEIGAYDGTTAYVHSRGVLQPHDDCECDFCQYKAVKKQCAQIVADWGKDGWTIATKLPHAKFNIVEDGEVFCRGIVLRAADLPTASVPS